MGRKLLVVTASLFIFFGLFVTNPSAQEEPQSIDSNSGMIAPEFVPPYPGGEPGFLGQDHAYTVVFRGNGEAVVSARVVLTNKGEAPLSEISLRVPFVEPKDIFVYQVLREKQCVRYGISVYDPATRAYPQVCEEYADPDYYNYWGVSKYQKAGVTIEGDTITITLLTPIKANGSGSYFMYFRTGGFVNKNIFGAFNYEFETLKVNDDIRNLSVGIDVDSDLYLKGVKGEIDYRIDFTSTESFKAVGGAVPVANSAIDSFYGNIGYGRITKTASNLAPLESYSVTGSYATNRLKLYGKELLIVFFAGLTLISTLLIVYKVISKRQKTSTPDIKSGNAAKILTTSAGIGFIASFLLASYTVLVIVLGNLITPILAYQYNPIFVLFLVLISFGVYALILFAPGVYIGIKRGISWGISVVVATIVWLIIFLSLAVVVLFLIGESSYPGPIVPLLENLR
jgi:hypothetical protein